jgi:hypothetical protein
MTHQSGVSTKVTQSMVYQGDIMFVVVVGKELEGLYSEAYRVTTQKRHRRTISWEYATPYEGLYGIDRLALVVPIAVASCAASRGGVVTICCASLVVVLKKGLG